MLLFGIRRQAFLQYTSTSVTTSHRLISCARSGVFSSRVLELAELLRFP